MKAVLYEGIVLLLRVSSHDFEPTFIILVLICRILSDQPKKRQITKPLTRKKHLSMLYFWAQLSVYGFGSEAKSLRTIAQRFCDFDLLRPLVKVDKVVEIQDGSRVPQCVLG